mmetsp:Transcript_86215/g.279085  ORF Transcript_86215/g.279085 Transcript_86215/m.279085 type:complete len:227 (+) Transcript_86215:1186-1866(+)
MRSGSTSRAPQLCRSPATASRARCTCNRLGRQGSCRWMPPCRRRMMPWQRPSTRRCPCTATLQNGRRRRCGSSWETCQAARRQRAPLAWPQRRPRPAPAPAWACSRRCPRRRRSPRLRPATSSRASRCSRRCRRRKRRRTALRCKRCSSGCRATCSRQSRRSRCSRCTPLRLGPRLRRARRVLRIPRAWWHGRIREALPTTSGRRWNSVCRTRGRPRRLQTLGGRF